MLQTGRQQVAREVERLAAAELHAEELHAGLVELMRLVEHHHVARVGSNSAMPDSRTARSAKNRWWLITTTSAAMRFAPRQH